MYKWLCCIGVLAMLLIIVAGCDHQGWSMMVTDTHDTPIRGAKICVWSEPVDKNHPEQSVERIGQAWEHGDMPMHGWFFTSDKEGVVHCTGFPTGHEVVDSYTPGRTIVSTRMGHGVMVWERGRWSRHEIIGSDERLTYVPARVRTHWKAGDWLVVTVTAPGYEPYHFAFHPDSSSGDLGSIQLFTK